MAATARSGNSNGPVSPPDESKYVAHDLIMQFAVSMALKAVLELGIPDILANAEGRKPLSADEILAQLPTRSSPGPDSSSNLRRLLRPLVQRGFFSELSFNCNESNEKKQSVYSLTNISELFVTGNEFNMLPIAALNLGSVCYSSWSHLHELILESDAVPFTKEHGVTMFEHTQKDPKFRTTFHNSMISFSKLESTAAVATLQQCGALEGVKTLVDVGGGTGSIVAHIVAQNPHIHGVNFDLPHVIAMAPTGTGVQHVGGNFFESVPSGDAMFLKFVIHNHGDEQATQILQNCFEALPKTGKVILGEFLLSEGQDHSPKSKMADTMDLKMLTLLKGARERTKEDYRRIFVAAGFSGFDVIQRPGCMDLIQGFKGYSNSSTLIQSIH